MSNQSNKNILECSKLLPRKIKIEKIRNMSVFGQGKSDSEVLQWGALSRWLVGPNSTLSSIRDDDRLEDAPHFIRTIGHAARI